MGASTGLLTDHYELTMVDAAIRGGIADRHAVFEGFARSLPNGRRYGVVAGLGRLTEAIGRFRFGDDELRFLAERDFLHDETLEWLREYRFRGDIHAYREGEPYFPFSPFLTVSGGFAECVVLETLVLSILNHDSAVASAGARMVTAAQGRGLLEFGSRRTHEQAAVAAARAAYLTGFAGTSNLEAGRRFGIPTLGTVAHAFIMIHDDERHAFETHVEAAGAGTTLLVDTYDTLEGVRLAAQVAGPGLGGVRLDSGELARLARDSRRILDDAGATDAKIVASGDLDEYRLAELSDAPIDSYGVGTRLVTGSGHPTPNMVYKLVARSTDEGSLVPEAKSSTAKATIGGRKRAARILRDGTAVEERVAGWDDDILASDEGRLLQVPVVEGGQLVHDPGLDEIREHHRRAMGELPDEAQQLDDGPPCLPTRRTGSLREPGEDRGGQADA